MATLHKFKLLATQCGVAQSSTLSPRTSPMVQLRRRKTTLRTLLGRSIGRRSSRRRESSIQKEHVLDSWEKKGKDLMRRDSLKLKDLFVSSPPREEDPEMHTTELGSVPVRNMGLGNGSVTCRVRPGSPKQLWTGFRCRSLLIRKAWRPVLLTIPE